jgi:hypothetical protein
MENAFGVPTTGACFARVTSDITVSYYSDHSKCLMIAGNSDGRQVRRYNSSPDLVWFTKAPPLRTSR